MFKKGSLKKKEEINKPKIDILFWKVIIIVIVVILAFFFWKETIINVIADEPPIQIDTLDYTFIEQDTWVGSTGNAPENNYGTRKYLTLDDYNMGGFMSYILMEWDVSSLLNQEIQSATLNLYTTGMTWADGLEGIIYIYPLSRNDWDEIQATFYEYKTGVNWAGYTGGVQNKYTLISLDDYNSALEIQSTHVENDLTWHQFDITLLVQGWADGTYDHNAGFMMMSDDRFYQFASSVHTNINLRPYIEVSYSSGSPPSPPTCVDGDEDGYSIGNGDCGPVDCDDDNSQINPGVVEVCDGVDNDCNLNTEDGSGETAPLNSNQEGICFNSVQICGGVDGWVDYYLNIEGYNGMCGDTIVDTMNYCEYVGAVCLESCGIDYYYLEDAEYEFLTDDCKEENENHICCYPLATYEQNDCLYYSGECLSGSCGEGKIYGEIPYLDDECGYYEGENTICCFDYEEPTTTGLTQIEDKTEVNYCEYFGGRCESPCSEGYSKLEDEESYALLIDSCENTQCCYPGTNGEINDCEAYGGTCLGSCEDNTVYGGIPYLDDECGVGEELICCFDQVLNSKEDDSEEINEILKELFASRDTEGKNEDEDKTGPEEEISFIENISLYRNLLILGVFVVFGIILAIALVIGKRNRER